jgi:hypothetical protein
MQAFVDMIESHKANRMGGGISSLSKAVIVHAPGADHPPPDSPDAFPGVPWANDLAKARSDKTGWDVVYRFCQVSIFFVLLLDRVALMRE